MRWKNIMLWAGALCLVANCGGCRAVPVESGAGEREVTIRTVTMFGVGDANRTVYNQIRQEFENTYDYITVEDESRTSDEQWKEQVVADFCVGNEPDVLQFFTDATANELVDMDKFVTLEEIREEYPEYAADTYTWALDQVTNEDGVQRAVPTTGFWEGLYCNQDLFDAYDVPLPTDMESLRYAIEVFRENDIVPIACSLSHVPHYWMEHFLLYSAGKELYMGPYDQVPQAWEDGLELFAELRQMGAFPENTDSASNEYVQGLFAQKQAAMLLEGNWYLPRVEDQEQTIVIAFPNISGNKVEEGTIIGGMTTGFYITRRAWNDPDKRDAAVKYVMAHTGKEAVQRYWENGGGTATTATEVEPMEDRTPLAKSAEQYLKQVNFQILPTDSRMDPEAYAVLINGIMNISHGSPAKALLEQVFAIQNESMK